MQGILQKKCGKISYKLHKSFRTFLFISPNSFATLSDSSTLSAYQLRLQIFNENRIPPPLLTAVVFFFLRFHISRLHILELS